MKDLKLVYKAVSKEAAEEELDRLEEKWRNRSKISYNKDVKKQRVLVAYR